MDIFSIFSQYFILSCIKACIEICETIFLLNHLTCLNCIFNIWNNFKKAIFCLKQITPLPVNYSILSWIILSVDWFNVVAEFPGFKTTFTVFFFRWSVCLTTIERMFPRPMRWVRIFRNLILSSRIMRFMPRFIHRNNAKIVFNQNLTWISVENYSISLQIHQVKKIF